MGGPRSLFPRLGISRCVKGLFLSGRRLPPSALPPPPLEGLLSSLSPPLPPPLSFMIQLRGLRPAFGAPAPPAVAAPDSAPLPSTPADVAPDPPAPPPGPLSPAGASPLPSSRASTTVCSADTGAAVTTPRLRLCRRRCCCCCCLQRCCTTFSCCIFKPLPTSLSTSSTRFTPLLSTSSTAATISGAFRSFTAPNNDATRP